MTLTVETVDGCVNLVKAEYTPLEWLVIHRAIEAWAVDDKCIAKDAEVLKRIIDTEPTIKEKGEEK